MTKKVKITLILAVALVGIVGVSVGVYNHFKLWHFKGLFGIYAKNYPENPKCDFNPRVNPNIDSRFSFIAHGGGAILANSGVKSKEILPTQIPKRR